MHKKDFDSGQSAICFLKEGCDLLDLSAEQFIYSFVLFNDIQKLMENEFVDTRVLVAVTLLLVQCTEPKHEYDPVQMFTLLSQVVARLYDLSHDQKKEVHLLLKYFRRVDICTKVVSPASILTFCQNYCHEGGIVTPSLSHLVYRSSLTLMISAFTHGHFPSGSVCNNVICFSLSVWLYVSARFIHPSKDQLLPVFTSFVDTVDLENYLRLWSSLEVCAYPHTDTRSGRKLDQSPVALNDYFELLDAEY
ncbi:hypothetical protein GEMRC1_013806 [Eukaryota sp. GEM-RC1]